MHSEVPHPIWEEGNLAQRSLHGGARARKSCARGPELCSGGSNHEACPLSQLLGKAREVQAEEGGGDLGTTTARRSRFRTAVTVGKIPWTPTQSQISEPVREKISRRGGFEHWQNSQVIQASKD